MAARVLREDLVSVRIRVPRKIKKLWCGGERGCSPGSIPGSPKSWACSLMAEYRIRSDKIQKFYRESSMTLVGLQVSGIPVHSHCTVPGSIPGGSTRVIGILWILRVQFPLGPPKLSGHCGDGSPDFVEDPRWNRDSSLPGSTRVIGTLLIPRLRRAFV